jgi:hypothetical protein
VRAAAEHEVAALRARRDAIAAGAYTHPLFSSI